MRSTFRQKRKKRLVCKISFCQSFALRTSALPTALCFWISFRPSKLRKNTMPRRFAPRQHLSISLNVKLGGVFWTKFEHFLTKIRIPNFKIQSLGRAKRKGVGGGGIFARPRFPPPPNFVFCFAKCATNTVALDPPCPFARNNKELPKISFTIL
ncbi:MAG: hypothetical protein YFSK_3780 [Candidatus Yanofskyibacterium parasiticum]|nr:MAG: hypothetical protein YFSK_3780 [Candidatus Yanofskybacteria bacterium]